MWRRVLQRFRRRADTGAGGTAPAADVGLPRRRDWAILPPLQPSSQQRVPEISQMSRFAADVVKGTRPEIALEPLGHEVRPEAPRGLAVGVARSILPSIQRDGDPPPLFRRRSRRRDATQPGLRWPDASDIPAPQTEEMSNYLDISSASAVQPGSNPTLPPAPVRVLRAATSSAPASPPMATPARPPELPLRPLTTRPLPGDRATGPATPQATPRTEPVQTSAPQPDPPAAPPPAGDSSPEAPAPSPTPPSAVHPTVGRRMQAPASSTDATAPAAPSEQAPADDQPGPRILDRPATPVSRPLVPSSDKPAATGEPPATAEPRLPAHRDTAASSRPGGDRPSVMRRPEGADVRPTLGRAPDPATRNRQRDANDPEPAATPAPHEAPQPPPAASSPGGPAPTTATPAGARPRRLGLGAPLPERPRTPRPGVPGPAPTPGAPHAAQRESAPDGGPAAAVPTTSAPPGPDAPRPRPTPGAPVPTRRLAPAVQRASQRPDAPRVAPLVSHGGRQPARQVGEDAAQDTQRPQRQAARQAPGTPDRPARVEPSADARPAAASPALVGAPIASRSAEPGTPPAARARAVAQRSRPLPVAAPQPPAPAVNGSGSVQAAPPPASTAVQLAAAARPTAGGPPVPIQRVEIGDVTATVPPPDAGATPAATDPDELFRQLYPRVRDELRWELLVQRERAGLLSDPL